MPARKTLYTREDDGMPLVGHVIEHDRKQWLVPSWLPGSTEGSSCPARIICLVGLPFGPSRQHQNVDLVLDTRLSRDILEGRKASQNPLVIERPGITVPDSDFDP
jgi:hypothetical protein